MLTRLDDGRFHGERPLTGAQLTAALGALASESGQPAVAGSSAATVSLTAFDARLVDQLGLADVAAHVQGVARGAGLNPPRSFGTEVVARFLGLRTNHPAQDDALELYPWEPITRAEAAHSLATILDSGGWAAGNARAQLSAFSLPAYGARTKRALRVAVSKIGMPYIWGGETDRASNSTFGSQAHGGYDCSGFVWRIFKLSGQPAGARIGGRTAAQMAGEIRKARAHPPRRRPARRPDLLRQRVVSFQGHRGGRRPRRHRALGALDDPLLGAGRLRVLARRRVATRPLHLGPPCALNLTTWLRVDPHIS